jgi:hypothetical protein
VFSTLDILAQHGCLGTMNDVVPVLVVTEEVLLAIVMTAISAAAAICLAWASLSLPLASSAS